jgi:flagellar hook protein FlgE
MFNSFSSALAALKAHSMAVDTVGHNLANVNTSGFKSVDVAFKDLVAQSMGGGAEIGMGVSRPTTVRNFSQGAVQASTGSMDGAIQGNGFFVVKDEAGAELYTRDGRFIVDKAGVVRTLTGERVQAYAVASDGTVATSVSDINMPSGASPARATTNMSAFANLNSNAAIGDTFGSSIEVVDSLGSSHVVTLTYTKTAANEWSLQASIPGEETGAAGATAGTPFDLLASPVTLTFDSNGKLATPDAASGTVAIAATSLTSGAADLALNLNLYDPAGEATISQASAASSTSRTTQDGVRAGQLVDIGMADGGRVMARYDSGETRAIAYLGIALTSNPGSLTAAGNNLFRVSPETAEPVIGRAGEGSRGGVKAGSLEASTVDIAREFTNLIVYQRGYQANSRVITTADELSQETLNLKR